MQRGGKPELEKQHGRLLIEGGEADIWGWGSPAGLERVRRRVAWLSQACGLRPGLAVLECGCGTGLFTRRLIESGASITAMDISTDLLARAREQCSAPNLTLIEGNLENPDVLNDAAFDAIYGISVLHHLNMPLTLKALRPKLRPGARFAFSEPNILNPINKYYLFTNDMKKRCQRGVSPGEMAFTPDELLGYFTDAGYIVTELAMRDFLHPAVPKSLIPLARLGEAIAERLPLIRLWSGSIWISGHLPRDSN